MGKRIVTVKDVQAALGVSRRTAVRVRQSARKAGLLTAINQRKTVGDVDRVRSAYHQGKLSR